nr:orf1ab polyprotein [Rodent astrovirus]
MYVNLVDRARDLVTYRGRPDLAPEAFVQSNRMYDIPSPWDFSTPLRQVVYLGPICQRRVVVASTILDNDWCLYVGEGMERVCVIVPPTPENQTHVLVEQALVKKDLMVRKNTALRGQISELNVKLMCQTGALARMTIFTTPPRRLRWYHWLLMIFLLLVRITTSIAQPAYYEPTLSRDVWFHLAKSVYDFLNNETPHDWLSMRHGWDVSAFVEDCVSAYESSHPVSRVFYLAVATLSYLKFGLYPVRPFHTLISMWVSVVIGLLFTAMPLQGVGSAWVQHFVVILAASDLDDYYSITYLRLHFLIPAVPTLGYGSAMMGIDPAYTGLDVDVFRLMRIRLLTTAPCVEIKVAHGRTMTNIAAGPGIFGRFFRRFKHLRTYMPPMTRVSPVALCRVRVPGSEGTGFFCANYIVKAGQVDGSDNLVVVDKAGHPYQTAVVRRVAGKDSVLLKRSSEFVAVTRYKVAKESCYDWVFVLAPYGNGAYITSRSKGFGHGDTISYANPIRDRMSCAPVVDPNDHWVGLHQTNTGHTPDAQVLVLTDIDLPSIHEIEVKKLKTGIERLKVKLAPSNEKEAVVSASCLDQCINEAGIVHLVRAAVGLEVEVLRDKLAYGQVKGETQHGRGVRHNPRTFDGPVSVKGWKRKRKVFSDEEYKELLQAGFEAEKIRELVDEILAREAEELGYRAWSDPHEDPGESLEDRWVGRYSGTETEQSPEGADVEQSQRQQEPKNEGATCGAQIMVPTRLLYVVSGSQSADETGAKCLPTGWGSVNVSANFCLRCTRWPPCWSPPSTANSTTTCRLWIHNLGWKCIFEIFLKIILCSDFKFFAGVSCLVCICRHSFQEALFLPSGHKSGPYYCYSEKPSRLPSLSDTLPVLIRDRVFRRTDVGSLYKRLWRCGSACKGRRGYSSPVVLLIEEGDAKRPEDKGGIYPVNSGCRPYLDPYRGLFRAAPEPGEERNDWTLLSAIWVDPFWRGLWSSPCTLAGEEWCIHRVCLDSIGWNHPNVLEPAYKEIKMELCGEESSVTVWESVARVSQEFGGSLCGDAIWSEYETDEREPDWTDLNKNGLQHGERLAPCLLVALVYWTRLSKVLSISNSCLWMSPRVNLVESAGCLSHPCLIHESTCVWGLGEAIKGRGHTATRKSHFFCIYSWFWFSSSACRTFQSEGLLTCTSKEVDSLPCPAWQTLVLSDSDAYCVGLTSLQAGCIALLGRVLVAHSEEASKELLSAAIVGTMRGCTKK